MFFLLSSFRFCSPLKNDGTRELRSGVGLNICLSFLNKGKKCSETGEKYGSDENLVEVGSVFQRY